MVGRMGRPPWRSGFTLAEVAVTLAIVGLALLWVLDGLNRALLTAAHTHNQKMARELALQTLGEIEAGLFWEEIDERIQGNYAEEGYDAFAWEVVLGEEAFTDRADEEGTLPYDPWRGEDPYDEELEDEDEEEAAEEPYEKVKVRVTFPGYLDRENELILERWVPWDQVYGQEEEGEELGEEEG